MEPSSSIIMILVTALLVINGKDIAKYLEWLRFKIKTYFKQLEENDRQNRTNYRPSELQRKQQGGIHRHERELDSTSRANLPRKQRVY